MPRLSSPGLDITRGQAARLLYTAAGEPRVDGAAFDHELTDVPRPLEDAVRWATHDPAGDEKPVMTGYADDTFRPTRPVSRASFITMLHRFRTSA